MRLHSGVKPHKCTECDKVMPLVLYIFFTCLHFFVLFNLQSFAEPSALKAHISATHREGENEFPCEFCKKVRTCCVLSPPTLINLVFSFKMQVIKGKSNLIRHMKTHVVGVVEEFTCQVCGKVVKGEGNFKYHIKSHTEEKKFECSVCQKVN